ncbi:hypothetical protein ACFVAJ_17500 [Agromyces sp. NPDC057679]
MTDDELLQLFNDHYDPDAVTNLRPGEDRFDAAFRVALRAVHTAGVSS